MIRWGIIGTGKIASKFKEALSVVSDAKLVAVASRNLEKAKSFVCDMEDVKTYGSYLELAQDDNIDAVYIATPHPYHKENTIMCLNYNKAVLCEKPFAMNAKDTMEVYELAKLKNVFLMEAMWTKFLPTTKKVQEWVNNDKIGEIKMIKADFGFNSPFNPDSRVYNKALGGGALLDVGIYPITYTTIFLGLHPESIKSDVYIGESGVDYINGIIMKYNEGKFALLSSAIKTDTPKDAVLIGTKGKIVIPWFWMSQGAFLYDENQNLVEEFHEPFKKNGYEYEIEEVNSCLKENKKRSELNPMEDTIRILEIMDKIRDEWKLKYPMED